MSLQRLAIVVPVFNEAQGIERFYHRLNQSLMAIEIDWCVLFVDDGSTDDTLGKLRNLHAADGRVTALSLSRNFGKERAIAAGLTYARGDAILLMDADLQHPPELVPFFVQRWLEGYKIVTGERRSRDTDGFFRRLLSRSFYAAFAKLSTTKLSRSATDFLLLDRQAVQAFNALGETSRFSKGLFSWLGFRSTSIPFDYDERSHGQSKWSAGRLLELALDGVLSFSTLPLRLWSIVGVLLSGLSVSYGAAVVIRTLWRGADVPGYPSIFVAITFFSGIQLISLGVIGEYLGRVFDEVKRRPLFLIAETIGIGVDNNGRPIPT
jgi:polyisoprenyl-phosphate glycosyltransferase